MNTIKLNDSFEIGNHMKPYFVAELNSSHNGDIEVAKQMILEAKRAGCNAVKFQSWSPTSLYANSYYRKNIVAKKILSKFSLTKEQLIECHDFCKENQISFSSTPYSNEEVDTLAELQVPFIKISSMDINNFEFIKYIASKQMPIILSTGMSTFDEIKKAVECIESQGNRQIIILHCVSVYPAAPDIINLNNIKTLQNMFPNYPIGYSDHTLGTEIGCASIALGACLIEKHFTLNNKNVGMDNNMAIEPEEMKQLVQACLNVFNAMGSHERCLSEQETAQASKMRRSIVTTRPLTAGTVLKYEDLTAKRPGIGLSPDKITSLVGKILLRDIEADDYILENDIE